MRPSFLRNVSAVFINELALYGLTIVSSILACRLLGPEQRGTFVVVVLTAKFIASVTYFGLPHALTYNLARTHEKKDSLGDALAVVLRIVPCSILIAIVIYGAAYAVGRETILAGIGAPLLIASFAFYLVLFAETVCRSVLVGLHDFRWRNVMNLVPTGVVTAALAAMWLSAGRPTALAVVWLYVAATVAGVAVGGARLLAGYRPRLTWRAPQGWPRDHLWYGLKFYVALVAQTMNYRLDTFILNALAGNRAVGLYSVGVVAAETLLFFPTSIVYVFYPSMASITPANRHRLTALTLGFSLYAVAGCGLCLAALLPWLVPLLYGAEFSPSVGAALWLIPGMLAIAVIKVLCHAFAGTGRPEYATYVTGVGLLCTVIADLLLIPRYGILGAAYASSISYSIAAAAAVFWYVRVAELRLGVVTRDCVVAPISWLNCRIRQLLPTAH